jgi:uncharacterized phage-associated protein
MAKAIDVANYLLRLAAAEPEAELVSHMRLQKLLYYVQGWALGVRGEPMFPEPIQAWQHGPVVASLYPCFADYGCNPIPAPQTKPDLSPDDHAFINSIWAGYRIHSAARLRDMTHSEPPWSIARGDRGPDDKCADEITHESMMKHFSQLMEKCEPPGLDRQTLQQAEADIAAGKGIALGEMLAEFAA